MELQRLDLGSNRLTGNIPPELGDLQNLKRLDLDSNILTGNIPPELGGLYSLQWFVLYNNKLTGYIPEELGSLSNLEQLYLSVNGFVGCIPDGLRSIQLSDHSVFGLPYCSDPPIPTPTPLNISCPHPGPIEESAIDRAALEALYWATIAGSWKNRLKWMTAAPIAEWHGVTTDYCSGRVTELNLSSNGLSGEIPPELGDLSSLEVLLLDSNYLRSEIPPELGQLANLRVSEYQLRRSNWHHTA